MQREQGEQVEQGGQREQQDRESRMKTGRAGGRRVGGGQGGVGATQRPETVGLLA